MSFIILLQGSIIGYTHTHRIFLFHFNFDFQSSWLAVKCTALFLNYILTELIAILPMSRKRQSFKIRFLLWDLAVKGSESK